MHEMGLAREIVQAVKDKLKDMKVEGRVSKINLRISKSAAVSPETLRFHFWVLAEATGFENAVLSIKEGKTSKVGVALDQQVVVESIEVE